MTRSHPNKAVDVFAYQNFSRGLLASAYQLMLALPPPLASRMRLLGMALPWWPASGPWPARLLPLSARYGVAAHTLLR